MNEFENKELNNESVPTSGSAEGIDAVDGVLSEESIAEEPALAEDTSSDEDISSDENAPAFTAASVTVGNSGEENALCDENGGENGEETPLNAKKTQKRSAIAYIYDYLETFCYALSLMMILFLFVFRYVSVDGESMMDTLHNNDKLIISDLFYTPKTGDIVVINPESHGDNGEPIIKRVIATGGQTVYIDYENWAVYVDGVKLDEPYIETMREVEQQRWGEDIAMNGTVVTKYKSEFTVSEGKVFVMGDNRNNSKDSRSREYGEMDENRILGRVIIRISPDFGTVD